MVQKKKVFKVVQKKLFQDNDKEVKTTEVKTPIPDFCKTHNIKWFPIDLSFEDRNGKMIKNLEYMEEYKAKPKPTDFKTLSNDEIIERQKSGLGQHIDLALLKRTTRLY